MRDFRHSKAMAQSLREVMATKKVALTHSESLEIVSKMFGVADWNTLSALICEDQRELVTARPLDQEAVTVPVLPIKDTVPFPATQMPLWIKRPKTIEALSAAFSSGRQIVLVAQRNAAIEEPDGDDVYEIGVMGRVIDVGPPSDNVIAHNSLLDGTTQVLVQTEGRVSVQGFTGRAGCYQAQIKHIDDGRLAEAPELIVAAAASFDSYSAINGMAVRPTWPPLSQLHDPGRVADMIARQLPISVDDKQTVLATLDPTERLQLVVTHMNA